MKKELIVKWQLYALGVILVMLLYRALAEPADTQKELIVVENLEQSTLYARSFVAGHPIHVDIKVNGAYQNDENVLAAYAWILEEASGTVVWEMIPGQNTQRKENYVAESIDSIQLPQGMYTFYFASYGNTIPGKFTNRSSRDYNEIAQRWLQSQPDWLAIVSASASKQAISHLRIADESHEDLVIGLNPDTFPMWFSGHITNNERAEVVIEALQNTTLTIHATGEIGERPVDYAFLESLEQKERIWVMSDKNSRYFGGAPENRRTESTVPLKEGLYRFVYTSDASHASGAWMANPPYKPAAWGAALGIPVRDKEDVRVYEGTDEFPGRQQARHEESLFDEMRTDEHLHAVGAEDLLLAMNHMGNSMDTTAMITLEEATGIHIFAAGEITQSGERYDYGSIVDVATGDVVWQMSLENTLPAGGHDSNRFFDGILRLNPGKYRVHFKTDETHAFGSFDALPPSDPTSWGISIHRAQ